MDIFDSKDSSLDDLLFALRNKEYGAYLLRRQYPKSLLKGFIGSVGILLLILLLSWLYIHKNGETIESTEVYLPILNLKDVPSLPKATPPAGAEKRLKFVSPSAQNPTEVVKDENIVEEPKPIDEKSNTTSNENITDQGSTEIGKGNQNIGTADGFGDEVFNNAEVMPQFPNGGNPAFAKYLINNVKYPLEARKNKIQGTVFIQFVITKNGSVKDVKILNGLGFGCNEEAIRLIESMPKWIPGSMQGHPVNVNCRVPITFQYKE